VVAVARRALREKRIGHTGTLDPMATGVLPLVIGKATRLSALLSADQKEYEADVRLGSATATYDAAERLAAGEPAPAPPDVSSADVSRALERFRGSFNQMPPPYSAKKVAGTPAYELARKNQVVDLTAVSVTVHSLELLGYESGLLKLRLRTSPGFYVRSLAHDIGVALGCGAHLEGLRRTASGSFDLSSGIELAELIERPDRAAARLIPLAKLLPELPGVELTEAGTRKASHGNALALSDLAGTVPVPFTEGTLVRLFEPSGGLLGIAKAGADGLLRPYLVLV
jgi:tRNA pseudouridine55 synthase